MNHDRPPTWFYAAITIFLLLLTVLVLPPLLILSCRYFDGVILGWEFGGLTESAFEVWNFVIHAAVVCVSFSFASAAASCLKDRIREEEKK